jgi:MoaA/NifB/PqqE/SkfB family radical SAM enzyme/GT2 family glycosyltransferase
VAAVTETIPRVSVIIATKNGQGTIGKCLESLAGLDYPHVEVIVVDDGSTDDTGNIVAGHVPRLPHLKVLATTGVGPSAARNLAVDAAAGAFVAFTDDDCVVDKNWLRELLKGFASSDAAGQRIGGVGGDQRSPDDDSDFGKTVNVFLKAVGFAADYVKTGTSTCLHLTAHNPSCNVMYPREVVAHARFQDGLWPGEDVELDYRLSRAGYVHRYNAAAVVYHYRPGTVQKFARMMFSYGRVQGYLVRRYGFFRKIHYFPWLFLGYVTLLMYATGTPLSIWLFDVPLVAALVYFLVKVPALAFRCLFLLAVTLITWTGGFFWGLVKKPDIVRMAMSLLILPRIARYRPRHMQMDVTTACNLNCRMCYVKTTMDAAARKRHLDLTSFKAMFDAARPLSVNLAASGEPFMNPELPAIIRYAKLKGAQVIISSNFIVPDEAKMREVIGAGLDILKISVDGATKATYETIRGGYFDRLCENIRTLTRILCETGMSARVRIDYVIMKPNAGEMDGIIDFAADNGIRYVFFRVCDPRGWDKKQREELLDGSLAAVREGMKRARRRARARGVSTNLPELAGNQKYWNFIYEDSTRPDAVSRPVCVLPWTQLFASVTGDMSCCCSIYPCGEQALGNVLNGDNWNTVAWQNIRGLFKMRKNYGIYEGCRYCVPMSRRHLFDVVRMFPGYIARLLSVRSQEKS